MQMTEQCGYLAAWQDRRRRMAVLKAIQFSFFLIPMTGWVTSSKYPTVYQRWGRQVLLAFPAWFLAYIAAGVWLNRFRVLVAANCTTGYSNGKGSGEAEELA
jgi:hypothetical protein